MEQTKFLGCLGNINLFEVNDRLIEILQTEKIIKKDNRDYGVKITDESKSITLFTHYKGNSYELSSELIDEIYGLLKNYVMRVSDSYHDFNDISFNSNAFLDKAGKIDYYKTQYQTVFPKDPQQFSIYRGQGKNGIQEWRDYCELWIADSTTLLNHYLNYNIHTEKGQFEIPIELRFVQYIKGLESEFSAQNDDFFHFLNLWIQFQEKDEILDKITDEIKVLKTPNSKSKKIKSLKDLFIDFSKYDEVIQALEKNNIIKVENNNYTILVPQELQSRSKIFISSIGIQLQNKEYLGSFCNKTDIVAAINHLFGTDITKQNYGSAYDSPQLDSYLKYTNFL